MADVAGALRDATKLLEAVSDTARLDAELLLAHALNISREKLLLDLPHLTVPEDFNALIERRMQAEPVAHLVGRKEFWGLEFQVSPDVLIPRPDSETLIEEAVRLFADNPPRNILDLGTGSGALLLAALHEFPDAGGTGIDVSAAALKIARSNADRLNMTDRAAFLQLDWNRPGWTDCLEDSFDLILANPPYVASGAGLSREVTDFEPHEALFAGDEGLDDYQTLIPALSRLFGAEAAALVEIGFDQAKSVSDIARENGYHVDCKRDLGGNDRLLIFRR